MGNIKWLEQSLDDDRKNNDGKLDQAELQLLDDFLNGNIITKYPYVYDQDNQTTNKQEKKDNSNYNSFLGFIEKWENMKTIWDLLLSQIAIAPSNNLQFYTALLEPLKQRATLSVNLEEYILWSPWADWLTKSWWLVDQMTKAIDDKKVKDKELNIKAPETHSNDSKTPEKLNNITIEKIYDQLDNLLVWWEKMPEVGSANLDTWIGQCVDLKGNDKMKDFVDWYKKRIQDKIGELKKAKNKDDVKNDSKKYGSILKELNKQLPLVIKNIETMILWPSVDDLLKAPSLSVDSFLWTTDKSVSTEYQKVLNNAFHLNKVDYEKLVTWCKDDAQNSISKKNAQISVLAYWKLMSQGSLQYTQALNNIKPEQIILGSELKSKESGKYTNLVDNDFYITKAVTWAGWTTSQELVSLTEKDPSDNTKTIEKPITISFGQNEMKDAKDNTKNIAKWTPYSFESLLEEWKWVERVKQLFPQNPKTKEVQVAETSKIGADWKVQHGDVKNFSDAFSAFFNSDMWDQINEIFLSLGVALAWKDTKEETILERKTTLDYIATKRALKIATGSEKITKNNNTEVSISDALASLNLSNKVPSAWEKSEMVKFCELPSVDAQKNYIITAIKEWKDKAKSLLNLNSSSGNSSSNNKEGKQREIEQWTLFVSWQEIAELKLTNSSAWKVDLIEINPKNPYLTIDGQVVALSGPTDTNAVRTGSIFVTDPNGRSFIEKTIAISGTDNKKISITESNVAINNTETPKEIGRAHVWTPVT